MLKNMRDYSHDEFVEIVKNLNEEELLDFSKNYGGYPVLFRMALDERIKNIPFIQCGAAVVIENNNKILLQERISGNHFSIPGGCQELGEELEDTAIREIFEETNLKIKNEDLTCITTVSGNKRRRVYPNGDVVYNNTTLFYVNISDEMLYHIKIDEESRSMQFYDINNLPDGFDSYDLLEEYLKFKK